MGDHYAAQTGGVGFHPLRVKARHHEEAAKKMIHETHEKHEKIFKKNLCNPRNLWFLFFIRLRARP
jgi:hypothetical protein